MTAQSLDGSTPAGRDDHEATLAHCRRLRRDVLKRWDDATESLIRDYEQKCLAIREAYRQQSASLREQLAGRNEKLQADADAKRINVLQKFDTVKSKPGQLQSRDHQLIHGAAEAFQRQRAVVVEMLRSRSVELPAADIADASVTLGITAPASVAAAAKSLEELTAQLQSVAADLRSPWASVTGMYLLPIAGLLGGIVIAGLILWTSAPAGVAVPLVVVALTTAVGVVAHFLIGRPLRRRTRQQVPLIQTLVAAARDCETRGEKISASVHRLEADDLKAKRDTLLAEIDAHLDHDSKEYQKQLQRQQHEHKQRCEHQLIELEQSFNRAIRESDAAMKQQADKVAAEIHDLMGS